MELDSPPAGRHSDAVTEYDAIVLGAGISGLVSASILLQQGNKRVMVVDEYDHVGGNHIDFAKNGYTFDVGSLIFQDDSPLLGHFPELLPGYLPIDPTWGKLNPQGVITQYPFSLRDDFLAAGLFECGRILLSTLAARLRKRNMENARDFAQYWIGARLLHRSGLESYMQRFCGLPAEKIDLKFAQQRMLWISENASMRNLVQRWLNSRKAPVTPRRTNQQLARPRGGFTQLYRPAVGRLEAEGVTFLLGADLSSLHKEGQTFHLRAGGYLLSAGRTVSTIPIDRLQELCGIELEKPLPTVTLMSLFFSFSGVRGFRQPILYNFSHEGTWKRLTMYSDFYGLHSEREFFTVEVIADGVHSSADLASQEFRRHTAANNLFVGDLNLEGSYTLSQAYPIYTEGAGERAERAIHLLRAFGIESFGRQGGFQYQPTSRVSTLEAEAALRPR